MTNLPDELNDPRVLYPAERTYLAWIRTGLALMGFGFVVARFGLFLRELIAARNPDAVQHPRLSLIVGISLVVLGVVVHAAAALRYRATVRQLRATTGERRWSLFGLSLGMVLAAIGVVLAAYLIYTR